MPFTMLPADLTQVALDAAIGRYRIEWPADTPEVLVIPSDRVPAAQVMDTGPDLDIVPINNAEAWYLVGAEGLVIVPLP